MRVDRIGCLGWYVRNVVHLVHLDEWWLGCIWEWCIFRAGLCGLNHYMVLVLCVYVCCGAEILRRRLYTSRTTRAVELCVWLQLLSFTASPRSCLRRSRQYYQYYIIITTHMWVIHVCGGCILWTSRVNKMPYASANFQSQHLIRNICDFGCGAMVLVKIFNLQFVFWLNNVRCANASIDVCFGSPQWFVVELYVVLSNLHL